VHAANSNSSKREPLKSCQRVGLFGGVYSNYLALEALLDDATKRGVQGLYCLGDLGAFGPFPDRVCQILRENRIRIVQGNYDNSIGNGLADCQCGYTDASAFSIGYLGNTTPTLSSALTPGSIGTEKYLSANTSLTVVRLAGPPTMAKPASCTQFLKSKLFKRRIWNSVPSFPAMMLSRAV
jgi:hypothetical protein